MKIFLSWSGDRSRHVALALRDWLPMILQNTEPWLSDRDIAAGERWALEIGKRLEECHFGIICLTQDNTEAPWVLFEAGALSKALATASVCPYLFEVELQEITGPLAQFQAKKADQISTKELVFSINQRSPAQLPQTRLDELFELLWPKLESKLAAVPKSGDPVPKRRSESEILEDLVGSVRRLDYRIGSLSHRIGRAGLPDSAVYLRLSSDEISPDTEFAETVESPGQVLNAAARTLSVDPKEFGSTWYFADPGSGKRVGSREELLKCFEGAPRVLYLQHRRTPF